MLAASSTPASADPEGGTKTLRNALESAARGFSDARIKLGASQQRQVQLGATMVQAQTDAKRLEAQVRVIAARSYRLGRFNSMSMLLNFSTPDTFLERAYGLDSMAQLDAQTLTRYKQELDL